MSITASITNCICVDIDGEPPVNDFTMFPPFLDNGLCFKFIEWTHDNSIYSILPGGYSGQGRYRGFYHPKDAPAIRTWLRDHNIKPED